MPLWRLDKDAMSRIRALVGDVDMGQLQYVDCFFTPQMVMFMPIAGPCLLAVSSMHVHPAPLFVVNFSDKSSVVLKHTILHSASDTVLYIPKQMPHYEVNETEIPRYVAILVSPLYLQEHAQMYGSCKLEWNQCKTFPYSEELISAVKRFIGECKSPRPGSEKLLEALSVEVMHGLLRSMLGLKAESNVYVSRIEINRCLEFMRQHLSEKLTLTSLACFSGMSVSQFTRVFRHETGLSPIDCLIEMRLEVACCMLLGGTKQHKQIAVDCGFSSAAHFSSSFQKKYKMSPSEFLQASSCR